jgi:hypothetical protein
MALQHWAQSTSFIIFLSSCVDFGGYFSERSKTSSRYTVKKVGYSSLDHPKVTHPQLRNRKIVRDAVCCIRLQYYSPGPNVVKTKNSKIGDSKKISVGFS